MIDGYVLSVLVFFLVLGILIYKDRKNIEFKYILLMRRTKRFREIIDKIANISPRFWRIFATFGVFLCFFYMAQGTYILAIFQPQVQFVLPSLSSEISVNDWSINIPFWSWMIVVFCVLVPHELFHGIIARAEKIKLKSVGLLLLAIFPGAFVEPDERQVKKAKLMSKLRIFAAGSFANFIISFLVFALTLYVIWPAFALPGIMLEEVNPSSPADLAGLEEGMVLTEINGKQITTSYGEYLSGMGYLSEEIGNVKAGQTIEVKAGNEIYDVKLGFNETANRTYMGITYIPRFRVNPGALLGAVQILTMISIFSLAIGIVNILPVYPLDGGLLIESIAEKYAKKKSKQIVRLVTFLVLLLLIYSFVKNLL